MRIKEVNQPSNTAINESVSSGNITESVGRILKEHTADQWSAPMTADECDVEDARILNEAGIQ